MLLVLLLQAGGRFPSRRLDSFPLAQKWFPARSFSHAESADSGVCQHLRLHQPEEKEYWRHGERE
jgi:hypothetical protein